MKKLSSFEKESSPIRVPVWNPRVLPDDHEFNLHIN